MSHDSIADVLGRLDYGDHPDDVDRNDRLREVDGLLDAGVVVDVADLLTSGAEPLWHDLRLLLHPLGWRPITWWSSDDVQLCWVLPCTPPDRLGSLLSPRVSVDAYGDGTASVLWLPAMGDDEADEATWSVAFFPTAAAFLDWLATP